jgi:O-antigen/teichoic acid export membrane protein
MKLFSSEYSQKIFSFGKLVGVTGLVQVLVQGVGLLSGILLVRILPVEQYALYTLANTMLGTMTVLADSGVSPGVMSQAGLVWKDSQKLGAVIATGVSLRRKMAIPSVLIASPILIYVLSQNDAGAFMSVIILLSLLPSFLMALSSNIYEIVPKLHQDIIYIQRSQLVLNISRFLLLLVTTFFFPFAFVAVLSAGVPQILYNKGIKKLANRYISFEEPENTTVRNDILKVVKRGLPDAIYYCFSGYLTLFLISYFGKTSSIASFGALGRISAIFTVFSMIVNMLLVPRYARLNQDRMLLLRNFLKILLLTFVISVGVGGGIYFFASKILIVFGTSYKNLETELMLVGLQSIVTFILGVIFSLNTARGWYITPITYISISILVTMVGILYFDFSSLRNSLFFNLLITVTQMLLLLVFGLFKIMKLNN